MGAVEQALADSLNQAVRQIEQDNKVYLAKSLMSDEELAKDMAAGGLPDYETEAGVGRYRALCSGRYIQGSTDASMVRKLMWKVRGYQGG